MKVPGLKKISPLFSVLAGKRGTKPAGWTGLAVVAEAAAISVGTAVVACAWPLSAAFFAASLVTTGISSATNASGAIGSHKHFAQITELSQQILALEKESSRLDKELFEFLDAQQEESREEAKAPDTDPANPDIQNGQKKKKLRTIFNLLRGKSGPKPRIWTGLAIAAEVAAITVGITVAAGAWPVTMTLSAAFFAASIATTGITSALNAASAVSNHKHFETVTELLEKMRTLQQQNTEKEKKLVAFLKAGKIKPQAAPASGPF
jgi:hypothetical protein